MDPPQQAPRHFAALRWIAAIVGASFLAFCAMRPLSAVDGLCIPDDGYICLELARSLGTGRGATFAGLVTNGFQPLWVLILAPMFALSPRAAPDTFVHAAFLLGAACATLTFALLAGWFRDRPRPAAWVIPLAAFWFPSAAVVQNALNAMETSLALLAVTAVLTALRPLDGAPFGAMSPRRACVLGVLLGLGVLARVDVGLLALGLGVVWLAQAARARSVTSVVRLAQTTAVATLVTAPWWLWSHAATGRWFPVSGRAVRVCSLGGPRTPDRAFYASMVDFAWQTWTRHYAGPAAWLLVAIALATLAVPAARRAWVPELRRRAGGTVWLFALALVAAYVGYFFAPWFFRRYFFPLQLGLAWAFAGAMTSLVGAPRRAWHAAAVALTVTATALAANLTHPLTSRMLARSVDSALGYRDVGLWAARYFPAGTVVGAGQSGALAYYARDLRVVNLDGVVSGPAYEAMMGRDLIGYARRRGVRYTLGWRQDHVFLRQNSRVGDRALLPKRLDVPGLRSWGYAWEVCDLMGR
jgi:4-amino-4-deoxy-L-arabinose transferase-like glycosyltransferase